MMDFDREKWMALQDLNSEDVADAICDSDAIVEAIRSHAWADVADMIRSRVELKAERLAQTALEIPLTPWVDSDEELQLWRFYRMELQREAIEQIKPKLPKINPYTSEASNEN
jgi:hypothetical protein